MANAKLVLVRHGLSVYNDQNRFTGWKDVGLNQQGRDEAKQAVNLLMDYKFDMAFTSDLIRAKNTLNIILEGINQKDIPVIENMALNERDYGDLIGQNKVEAAEQFGEEQVHIWRRSFDTPPPGGESLKDTADRVIPYLKNEIMPLISNGKNISAKEMLTFAFDYFGLDYRKFIKISKAFKRPKDITFAKTNLPKQFKNNYKIYGKKLIAKLIKFYVNKKL